MRSLRSGREAFSPVTRFDVSGCRTKQAGQVCDAWLEEAAARPRFRGRHRASRMLLAAAQEAMAARPEFVPEVIVIGTTSGGMSFGEAFYRSVLRGRRLGTDRARLAEYMPQSIVVEVMRAFGFRAPVQVIANACASGTNAIGRAFELIRSGRARRVLCGGYDALAELVFAGFDCLQASTTEKCRPFDRARSGLLLGEGAAVFLLERGDAAEAPLGRVRGYGISTDNHHFTQPHPSGSGAKQAMEAALRSADLPATAVEYINAHGTATPLNDASEGRAIAELFGRVPVSSTKAMMGHALGAAGAIEAALCLMAMREGFLPANLNFREGDEGLDLDVVGPAARPLRARWALSNSFGFGGTNASVILEAA